VTQHSRDTPQFYLTAPSPCPYLAGKEERKVFTHLVGERAGELNNILTQGGFRRSQSIAYRPACEGCRACVSVRVVAKDFRPTPSMRRITRRNADIVSEMRIAVPTSEQYAIFRAYLDSRHRDGGMADMTVLDYAMMVEDSHIETRIIEYRRNKPDAPAGKRASGRNPPPLASPNIRSLTRTPVRGHCGTSKTCSTLPRRPASSVGSPMVSESRSLWSGVSDISWNRPAAWCERARGALRWTTC